MEEFNSDMIRSVQQSALKTVLKRTGPDISIYGDFHSGEMSVKEVKGLEHYLLYWLDNR